MKTSATVTVPNQVVALCDTWLSSDQIVTRCVYRFGKALRVDCIVLVDVDACWYTLFTLRSSAVT